VICHVHENQFTISSYYSAMLSEQYKQQIDQYIAVSNSTRNNLLQHHGLKESNVALCYEFVPVNDIRQPSRVASDVKKELGISNEFVVGGCGSGITGWRKGIDLFIYIAASVKKRTDKAIKFVWVGQIDRATEIAFEYERERLGLTNEVLFTGVKSDPENYFQVFDVFALTSREDPFPLVCLEAAAQGKPVICFENSGGMPEFVAQGAGYITPYGDVQAMADQLLQVMQQPEALQDKGKRAKELSANYDVSQQAPQIVQIIEGFL